ncbi:MAG TPA: inorganic diphosphatase [Longimicrobiales bacterium]|nr:inorganic diphosphatase [Longimicrobiales bacterium]
MTHPLHDLPTGPDPPHQLTAFIEIPRGSRNKYELDKATGLLRLDRILYASVHYPGDYGLLPRTLGEDSDPLDVLVMTTEPTFAGCTIVVRPIGAFLMEDDKGNDEKILAVPVADPLRREMRDLDDVPPHFLDEVRHFFAVYKDLEGKRVHTIGWEPRETAERLVCEAMERYVPPGR